MSKTNERKKKSKHHGIQGKRKNININTNPRIQNANIQQANIQQQQQVNIQHAKQQFSVQSASNCL